MDLRKLALAAALSILWLAAAPARVQGATTTTVLTASPSPATATASITLTATVSAASGTPTGTVSFSDGSNILPGADFVALSGGVARFSTTLAVGQHALSAHYGGALGYVPSTGTCNETVNLAPTTTATTANVSVAYSTGGQSVPLSASVTSGGSAVGSGSVLFSVVNGNAPIGPQSLAQVSDGTANGTFMMQAGTAPGVYTIQASYSGTSVYASSGDNMHTFTVTPPPPTAANAQGAQIIGCNYVVFSGTAYPGSAIGGAFTDALGNPWPGAGTGQLTFATTVQSGSGVSSAWSATLTVPVGLSGTGLTLTVSQQPPGQGTLQSAAYTGITVQTTQPVAVAGFGKVNGQATVTMNGCAGETYQLQRTPSLTQPSWVTVVFAQPTACGPLTLTDPGGSGQTTVFYRVLVQ